MNKFLDRNPARREADYNKRYKRWRHGELKTLYLLKFGVSQKAMSRVYAARTKGDYTPVPVKEKDLSRFTDDVRCMLREAFKREGISMKGEL